MNFTIFMDQLKDLRSTKYKYLLGAFVIFALVCVFGVLDAIWLIIRGPYGFLARLHSGLAGLPARVALFLLAYQCAGKYKAEKKQLAIASLRDCPTSPRKMRIVADTVRGVEVNKALALLRYSKKEASVRLEKLLRSAIANWEAKNPNERLEDTKLCVKEIKVDGGRMLKRIQPAPQGRAHRIRKRSNHVTIIVDKMVVETKAAE